MKNLRWWLILAFAVVMARPSTKRCTMCIEPWDHCAIPAGSANKFESSEYISTLSESLPPLDSDEKRFSEALSWPANGVEIPSASDQPMDDQADRSGRPQSDS